MSIDLSTYLSRIPDVRSVDPASCTRLAGLTNVNFLVPTATARFVVRVPGSGTSEYINRADEEVAARSAARASVNAEVVFFDASDGLMMTRFADGAETMSAETFRDLAAVRRAGEVLRRLHDDAEPFATEFHLFPAIDGYRSLLASKGATLPDGFDRILRQAESVRNVLEANPVTPVASHCDPLCENFLDTGSRMLLIDYEYAGNNDPMWDLGDLSVEGCFDESQERALLEAYFGGPAPDHQIGRMVVYKAMCDLLWSVWGLLQHVNANPVEDFQAYAAGRFDRCRTLMESPEFARHVGSITG